jgi:predicted PhzF superfamily epimerase YddE/YHI9
VLEAEGLDADAMQAIAREFNHPRDGVRVRAS